MLMKFRLWLADRILGKRYAITPLDEDGVSEPESVCAQLYQVIGNLADEFGVFDHPEVQRALDNASRCRLVHRDLLPWPKTPLGPATG